MTEPITSDDVDTSGTVEVADDDEQVLDMAAMRKVRREAAELRKRNRELEEQLEGAAARETAHQRAMVEHAAAAAGMIDPSDFLAVHPDPSEFADEFHNVVGDRVAEAAAALIASKPHLGRPVGAPPTDRPLEGLRPGARAPEDKKPAPSWATALRG